MLIGMDFLQRSLYTLKHNVGLTCISNEQMPLMVFPLFISPCMRWGEGNSACHYGRKVVAAVLYYRPPGQSGPGVFHLLSGDPDEAMPPVVFSCVSLR